MFSAYMLDPEHGWIGIHRLPLDDAIRICKEHRERNAGCLVAIVPDHANPEELFDELEFVMCPKSRTLA